MNGTKYKILNEFLFHEDPEDERFRGNQWAFCVHKNIMDKMKMVWHKYFKTAEQQLMDYKLQIGDRPFDMIIVYVTLDYNEELTILRELIKNSQFSFPWEDSPTLFINAGSFNILQQFVRNHNLNEYIVSTEERPGVSVNSENIKVITFKPNVGTVLNVTDAFKEHLKSFDRNQQNKYYYMTFAFPWLLPQWLKHFDDIPIDCDNYVLIEIIFSQLRGVKYTSLCLFDLLSIRLALCDVRQLCPLIGNIKTDIDEMIKQKLSTIVKNNHLDLDQYMADTNSKPNNLLISYLVYEFQDSFQTIKINRQRTNRFCPSLGVDKPSDLIELVHDADVFDTLNRKRDCKFYIDGRGYDKMSFSLFWKFVESNNVATIYLDTNYKWLKDECEPDETKYDPGGRIYVLLAGTNEFNFVENFVASLKTMPFTFKTFTLHIYSEMNDYMVFDGLIVYRVDFRDIRITSNMLDALNRCNIKTMIRFYNCTIENRWSNWIQLKNLYQVNLVEVHEEENTWQCLFDFILNEIRESNRKEFQFERQTLVVIGDKRLNFETFKFTYEEDNSKLVIRERKNNEILELYDIKYRLGPNHYSDYHFYQ